MVICSRKIFFSLLLLKLTIIIAQPLPTASFTVSSNTVCTGKTIICTDISSNNPSVWIWSTPGATIINPALPTSAIYYTASGIYTISLSVINSGGTSTNVAIQTITVYSNPTLSIVQQPKLVCRYETATVTVTGAQTYSGGCGTTYFNSSYFTLTAVAGITCNITGIDSNGCSANGNLVIKSFICEALSVKESELDLSISAAFPNPTCDKIYIHTSIDSETEIKTTDLLGKQVPFVWVRTGEYLSADLNLLEAGIYYLYVRRQSKWSVQKLIKK